MGSFNETGIRSFTAGEALEANRLVRLNSSAQLVYNDAGEEPIGVTQDSCASGAQCQVKLFNFPGTRRLTAAGAILAAGAVFAADDGKIVAASATSKGPTLGTCLEAASGTGAQIEVLPCERRGGMTILTADATLTRSQRGSLITNLGAAGAVAVTLPQDAVKGDQFHFSVMTAQQLRIDPGAAGALYISGAKQTDDAYAWADDEGESITFTADGNGDWIASSMIGTWTVV